MGANNSTRRVSFESDENDNITVVKGIRLSENVIKRMQEPTEPKQHHHTPSSTSSTTQTPTPPPLLKEVPPPFDLITSLPSPVVPVLPSAPSASERGAAPPSQRVAEQVASPTLPNVVFPSSPPLASANAVPEPAFKPLAPPSPAQAAVAAVSLPTSGPPAPTVSEVIIPHPPPPVNEPSSLINPSVLSSPPAIKPIASAHAIEPLASPSASEPICPHPPLINAKPIVSPVPKAQPPLSPPDFEPATILPASIPSAGDSVHPQSAEPFASLPLPEFTAPCEPVAPPSQPAAEPLSPASVTKPVTAHESGTAAAQAIDEEALKKKITDELHKNLKQQRVKAEQDMQAWYEAEKARLSAKAQVEAQSQFRDEVSKILSAERAAVRENLHQTIIRERIATEDEKLRAQLFDLEQKAKQLEAKEADLKKQDAFYREQVARLEERSTQFYKVTTENYHKAADQVNAKCRRYEVNPVCADLQGQILACYKENAGRTLNCSNIAALYLQCVNNAKENKRKS
ncbi:MICOS complex subunit Mic25 isoform X2 [Oryzias latipes]|uniref:MICOS complex subunit Mic25 isoform X2 n=1 Tax=Oryzias latipes TaxID=8090 RepID=UPI0009D94E97|nr:MICOS complex subunit Mic25 isoform X2 [Oryzias latipes]